MKAKEYLLEIQQLERMIKNKLYEIASWKDKAVELSQVTNSEKVRTTKNTQIMADIVTHYVDLEDKLKADIVKLTEKKQDIIKTIEQLSCKDYDILHMIYVQNRTLQDVSYEYACSYKQITRLHTKALQNLQEILDKREKCIS